MNKTHAVSIACIGEAMIELSFPKANKSSAELGFAGDTLNTAIYLRRNLEASYKVSFVSALGTDSFSDEMINFISEEEVLTQDIERIDGILPGLYTINTDAQGERSFCYWRENSAARMLFQKKGSTDFKTLEKFEVLYYSAITLAILPELIREQFLEWLSWFRNQTGRIVVFDSNYRPQLWASKQEAQYFIEKAWHQTDIALPSIDDEMMLFGDANESALLNRFRSYKIECGVLKRGGQGPVSIHDHDTTLEFRANTNIIDSTAAGDSFSGAFLASYLSGNSLQNAMLAGHNQAYKVLAYRGAIIPKDNRTSTGP